MNDDESLIPGLRPHYRLEHQYFRLNARHGHALAYTIFNARHFLKILLSLLKLTMTFPLKLTVIPYHIIISVELNNFEPMSGY